jgi:hypothetical protein
MSCSATVPAWTRVGLLVAIRGTELTLGAIVEAERKDDGDNVGNVLL